MKQNTYTIKIPRIKLFGYHGCYDKEKKEGQEFEIDIEVVFKKNVNWDDWKLEDSCDYTKIVSVVQEIFEKKRCDILEELARNIGNLLFKVMPYKEMGSVDTELVKVNIRKFNPEGMNVPYVEVGCVVSYDK